MDSTPPPNGPGEEHPPHEPDFPEELPRRRFVQYAAGLGILAGLGLRPRSTWAATDTPGHEASAPVEYDLVVDRLGVSFSGERAQANAINQTIPGPLVRLREGQEAILRVTNRLDEDTSLHWHGLLVPSDMDGVPGISFDGIKPGETFTYRFPVRQSGTYWFHSHSGGQEQQGVYAPLVVDPAGPDPVAYDREHVVVLSDWTDESPHEVLRNLKGNGGYYNYGRRTLPQFIGGLFKDAGATLRDREMWGRMRMDPTDVADVSGATYTYLLNGRTAAENWTGIFRPGERVRLRIINASAMTYFDVKIPGLKMSVVQADGQDVEPVPVDEIRVAVAETYDVVVEPRADERYTLFAQSMDRSGYVRGTLAEREGAQAPIPPLDPRPLRIMRMGADDMRMSGPDVPGPDVPSEVPNAMAGMDHAAMASPQIGSTHRRLEYSDLRALTPNRDFREPEREVVLRLTGDMERYFWTLNDQKLSESDPIRLRLGERVRVRFVNETMMEHPMHLHGVFMELRNGQDATHAPRKHTISVPPFETVEADVTFEEEGPWAFHCHLLYHMMTGMFIRVEVEGAPSVDETEDRA